MLSLVAADAVRVRRGRALRLQGPRGVEGAVRLRVVAVAGWLDVRVRLERQRLDQGGEEGAGRLERGGGGRG